MVEGRLGLVAIHEIGGAHAELAQHAATMAAFQHAVMAGVGDVQALGGHRQPGREAQREARLGTEFTGAVQILIGRPRAAFA
ncbi:hypothetical protein D3C81_2157820 [compost metagenome]